MLDGQRRPKRAQEFRGPATRLFGPIGSTAEARAVIRAMCLSLLGIGAVVAVSTVQARTLGITAGAFVAVPAAALYLSRSRIAAVALLLSVFYAGIPFVLGIRGGLFVWFACVFMAGRASRAAFKLRQYS